MAPIRFLATALAAATLILGACGDDDSTDASSAPVGDASESASPSTADVTIVDFEYDPQETTVAPGAAVTFTNQDDAAHTATNQDGAFNTRSIEGGAEGSVTAPSEPGSYAYVCSFHPFMKGTLVVE